MTALIEQLLAARESRAALPDSSMQLPSSLDEAYRLQEVHAERLIARHGGRRAGYKLGATNAAIQTAMGLDKPFRGPILSHWVHPQPAALARSDFFLCVVEAEIAFRLGSDLPFDTADYTIDMLSGMIAEAFPAIEIADTRLKDWQRPDARAIIADLGFAGALIAGQPCADWRGIDLPSLTVTLTSNDVVVAKGSGAMVLGDPMTCLLDFARQRAAAGHPLQSGDIVSSGTCTPPYPAKAGEHLIADLGPLGTVALTLT